MNFEKSIKIIVSSSEGFRNSALTELEIRSAEISKSRKCKRQYLGDFSTTKDDAALHYASLSSVEMTNE